MPEKIGELHPYLVQVLNPSGTVEGTGFLCHRDGFVLTCWHVMEPWRKESTTKGTVGYAGKLISADWLLERSDQATDLAVLKLEIPDDQEIPSLPLDVYEVHQRTELTDPLESVGYPVGQFQESGIATTAHLQGKSPTKVNGLTMYPVTGFYVGNINHGYSGAPFFNRTTQKVVGLVHAKQHDKQAFLIPLTPIFTRWPGLRTFHDVFEQIRQRLGQLAQARLDERLRGAPFIPPSLEVGTIPKREEGSTRPQPNADTQAYAHGRHWETFSLKQLLPPRRSFVLSSDVGTGKSVFLDWIAVELVNKTRAVPIVMTCQALEQLNSPSRDDMIRTVLEQLRGEFSSHDIEAFIAESSQKSEFVFLFDGLDQIGSGKPSALVAQVLSTVVRHPVLITSRPSAVLSVESEEKLDILRLLPFSDTDQRTYFGEHYAKSKTVCATAPDLTRVPMLAYMVRALVAVGKSNETITRTELYKQFIKYIQSKHESNIPIFSDNPDLTDDVQQALQELAYASLATDEPHIQKVPKSAVPKGARFKIAQLPTFGLLNLILDEGEHALFFTHQSFQEFLAAKHAAVHLECVDKIFTERWNPKWAEVIRFLAGLQGEALVQRILCAPDNVIHSNLLLAARCAGETETLGPDLKGILVERLMVLSKAVPFRRDAIEALGTMVQWLQKDQIRWLRNRLDDEDSSVQEVTVKVLANLGDRLDDPTVKALVGLLHDDNDSYVRMAAAETLGKLEKRLDEATVKALIALLHDDDLEVPTAAAESLGNLGDRLDNTILPTLAALLRDDDSDVRRTAVQDLGLLRDRLDDPMVKALVGLLHDNDLEVRRAVIETLGNLGDRLDNTILPTLVALLRDDADLRWDAVKALSRLGDRLDDSMVKALVGLLHDDNDSGVRKAAAWTLADLRDCLGNTMLPTFVGLLGDNDSDVRRIAAQGLGLLRDRLDDPTVKALVALLRDDNDIDVRRAAGWALVHHGDCLGNTMLPTFVGLLSDNDSDVRQAAASALGRLRDRLDNPTVKALIGLLHNDNDIGVRRAVALTLANLGDRLDDAMLATLVESLLRDQPFDDTSSALGKLRDRLDDQTGKSIVRSLHDNDDKVRMNVVWNLANLRDYLDDPTVKALVGLLHADNRIWVRQAVAWTLGKLGKRLDETTVRKLADMLSSKKGEDAVYQALKELYRVGVALPTLKKSKQSRKHGSVAKFE